MPKPKRPFRVEFSTGRVRTYSTYDAAAEVAREHGGTITPEREQQPSEGFRGWPVSMLLRYIARLQRKAKVVERERDAAMEANRAFRERMRKMAESNDALEFYVDERGEYRWRRIDPDNGRIISGPGEGFSKQEHAEENARRANTDIPEDRWTSLIAEETDESAG